MRLTPPTTTHSLIRNGINNLTWPLMISMKGRHINLSPLFLGWLTCAALILCAEGCGKSPKSESARRQEIRRHVEQLNYQELHKPTTVVAFAAMQFLANLKKEGRLPGAQTSDRGFLRWEKKPQMGGAYYSSVEIHYLPTNLPPHSFFYLVTQVTSNSPPKLEDAWSVGQDGSVHHYPVQ